MMTNRFETRRRATFARRLRAYEQAWTAANADGLGEAECDRLADIAEQRRLELVATPAPDAWAAGQKLRTLVTEGTILAAAPGVREILTEALEFLVGAPEREAAHS
ncbi:MAG: hypothetical protein JO013_10305 [Alphaproteobacteria bacterium]|nr:hypothetical protein [Alphaproteobacteria bacterium]